MQTLTVTVLIFAAIFACTEAARLGCYYGSWAVYRQGDGHFDAENIDPTLCTHVLYSFAKLTDEGELKVYDDYNDVGDEWHIGQFTKLQALREKSPSTKFMIAVGGWNHGPGTFQSVVVNPQKRQRWVDSSVDFCRKYGFDGLDIDWEYQDSSHGGTPEQLAGFSEALRMFRQRFNSENLLLSAATAAGFHMIEDNYDLAVLSQTLDFINLMTYDLHGAWEKFTGHHTQLHAAAAEQGDERNLNIEAVLKKYIERGADPAKINLGLGTYGRGFTLADANQNGMRAPTYGPSQMGQLVPEAGILGYDEICRNRWQEYWDQEEGVVYAVKGDQWVGYDNTESLSRKIEFAKSLGVTNFFIWSIETDDFTGTCSGQKFPLLNHIKNTIN